MSTTPRSTRSPAPRHATGRGSSVRGCPSHTRCIGRHRRHPRGRYHAHATRPDRPRHQPDCARPADRGHRPRAGPAWRRHARRRCPRAGHGASRRRRHRGGVLDRQRSQVVVRAKGAGMLHVRADARDRIAPLVVSHGWNDPRADRSRYHLPRLARHRRSDRLSSAAGGHPIRGRTRPGWLDGTHGEQPGAREAGARHPVRRPARDAAAPDSMLGSMAAVPPSASAGSPPASASRRRSTTKSTSRCRCLSWPVAAARGPGEAARGILVRVSAQRYNRADEYERLADTLVARLAEKKRRR